MASGNFSQPLRARRISELVGVTPKTVQNWRAGRAVPSPLAARRLAELGILFEPPRPRPKPKSRGRKAR